MSSGGLRPNSGNKSQELPAKEQLAFRVAIQAYEDKDYKKSLKTIDSLLKKYPSNGESLAIKGLLHSHLPTKIDANPDSNPHALIKKGIQNNFASPISWHVYGLLHKAECNYTEASKCYTQSLKLDPNNLQILTDLSTLQVHGRSFEGFNQSRAKLLEARPQIRSNWIAYAVSFHLASLPQLGLRVLKQYEIYHKNTNDTNISAEYEESELIMYRNFLIEECGNFKEALDDLELIKVKVKDKVALRETRVRLLMKSKKFELAQKHIIDLITLNPDNIEYITNLKICKNLNHTHLSDDQVAEVLELYQDLAAKYPRSSIYKQLPLLITKDEQFTRLVTIYIKAMIRKGVPSLYNSISQLAKDPSKQLIIQKVVEGFEQSLSNNKKFDADETDDTVVEEEAPTSLLWIKFFLAQLYDSLKLYSKAIEMIDSAIAHTPTSVELYLFKARILKVSFANKHTHNHNLAMQTMEIAQSLDLQDRFTNTKLTKYLLRADEITRAQSNVALFTRDEPTKPDTDLIEMQCIWYAHATAKSHHRSKRYGLAMKWYTQIQKFIHTFIDDQLDFHAYAIRKQTLRSYVGMVRGGSFYSHAMYKQMVVGVIDTCVLLSVGGRAAGEMVDGVSLIGLSIDDRKRLMKKDKKVKAKIADAEDDLYGLKFIDGADHLLTAHKFLSPFLQWCPSDLTALELGCRVYSLTGKYLLVVKCLMRAFDVEGDAAFIFFYAGQLYLDINKHTDVDLRVRRKVEEGLNGLGLTCMNDLEVLVSTKLVSKMPKEIVYAAHLKRLMNPLSSLPTLFYESVFGLIEEFDFDTCVLALSVIQDVYGDFGGAARWKSACGIKYPYEKCFESIE